MANFCIFVDESGLFRSNVGTLGMHVAVAVVVAGTRDEVEARVETALRASSTSFGLPFHKTECADEHRLASRLRDRIRRGEAITGPHLDERSELHGYVEGSWAIPSSIALRRSFPRMARAIRRLGSAIRADVCRSAADLLDEGALVLCLEYGQPGGAGADRWSPSITAVVAEAAIGLATIPHGPHRCEVVVGQSGGACTFDFTDLEASLARATSASRGISAVKLTPSPVPTTRAADCIGLQLADVFAHELGPRSRQLEAVDGTTAWNLTLKALRDRFADAFGPGPGTGTTGGRSLHACSPHSATHERVRDAVASLGRPDEKERVLSALVSQLRSLAACDAASAPRHLYRCSVEGALELVIGLQRSA